MRFIDEVFVILVCESVFCGIIVFEWDRESSIVCIGDVDEV